MRPWVDAAAWVAKVTVWLLSVAALVLLIAALVGIFVGGPMSVGLMPAPGTTPPRAGSPTPVAAG